MKKVYVFPGQGAQFPNMGEGIDMEQEEIQSLMTAANDLLGFDLYRLMIEGDEEDLKQTHVTQPALFVHSLLRLKGSDVRPDLGLVAGHSLGEFSAIVAAGGLTFEEGLILVKERSQAMKDACDETPGTMAAILGLEDDTIQDICDETPGIVVPANFNSPGQVVISGEVYAVRLAGEKCSSAGARRVVPLVVGGAFHSPLMASAENRLARQIESLTFRPLACPIVQNVDGQASENIEIIKDKLVRQLTSPVRWTQTMQTVIDAQHDSIVEVGGNGKVLKGLFRRMDRSLALETL